MHNPTKVADLMFDAKLNVIGFLCGRGKTDLHNGDPFSALLSLQGGQFSFEHDASPEWASNERVLLNIIFI